MSAKRLTRKQKILLSKKGFQTPGQFLLFKETETEMILRDKATGTRVTVPK